jgi:hypothetical protein
MKLEMSVQAMTIIVELYVASRCNGTAGLLESFDID